MSNKPTSKRRHFTAEQKAAIVRRHMVDKVPVSDLCDEYGIQPSVLHGWHKLVADNLAKVFDSLKGGDRARADVTVSSFARTSRSPRSRPASPRRTR